MAFFAKLGSILIKYWNHMINIFWLFKNPEKIKDVAEKPRISENARFCPQCDKRMELGSVYGDGNWFKCKDCNKTQWYKTRQ